MKKFLFTSTFLTALFLTALVPATPLHAQTLPEFKEGKAYVFDANAIAGKAKDSIKTKNLSSAKNFEVTVYGYKNNQWEKVATGFLRQTGDSDSLKRIKKIKSFQYLAVTTNADKEFNYVTSKRHDDLYIYFMDKTSVSEERVNAAPSFDISKVKGKFKDNIKIESRANFDDPCSFFIYGCKEENGRYELLTCLALKDGFDTDSSDESYSGSKLSSYGYIKILPASQKEFTYSLSKSHNDLIIQIQ